MSCLCDRCVGPSQNHVYWTSLWYASITDHPEHWNKYLNKIKGLYKPLPELAEGTCFVAGIGGQHDRVTMFISEHWRAEDGSSTSHTWTKNLDKAHRFTEEEAQRCLKEADTNKGKLVVVDAAEMYSLAEFYVAWEQLNEVLMREVSSK